MPRLNEDCMLAGQPGAEAGHMVGCSSNPWVTSRDSLERMINQPEHGSHGRREIHRGRAGVSDALPAVRACDCLTPIQAMRVPDTLMTVMMRPLQRTTTPRPARSTTQPAQRHQPCSTPAPSRLHNTRSQSAPMALRPRCVKRDAPVA